MSEAFSSTFIDLDPATGQPTPTTHQSMRAAFHQNYAISEHIPEAIRKELHTAIDVFALAYGQANANNTQLYNPLTDDAFVAAMRAFELALRDRLVRPISTPLARLIEQAMQQGLLQGDIHTELFFRALRETRNALVHGEGERHLGGSFLGQAIGILIVMINDLYNSSSTQSKMEPS